MSVPVSALLTSQKIPLAFREKFLSPISVQGLIACYLCCDHDARLKYAAWRAVWPSMEDFEDCLPLLWPEYLTGRETRQNTPLPPSLSGLWRSLYRAPPDGPDCRTLLAQQEKRLRDAYVAARTAFPEIDWRRFVYYWVVVNTRCVYYVPAGAPPPKDRNDAMALCPFADYFNHSDKDGVSCVIFSSGNHCVDTPS